MRIDCSNFITAWRFARA